MNKINIKTNISSIGQTFMQKVFNIKSTFIIFSLCFCYFGLAQEVTLTQEFTLMQVSDVCTNLKTTIRNKLTSQPNWQMTLTDENSNILGYGAFGNEGIDINVYNNNYREFYIFFFTNSGPIHFADGSTGFRANHFVSNYTSRIVITHRLKGNSLLHLNDCNISLRDLFTGYKVSIH